MALVVLLRGLNVGGHRRFRPRQLAETLRHLGAVNIGAAGTLVIRKPVGRAALRAAIARALPFDAEVMICDEREIAALLLRDPLAGQPVRPDLVRFFSVLSRRPRTKPPLPIAIPAAGPWLVKVLGFEGRLVFGIYRRQMKVIGQLAQLDRIFGVPATTRSWTTLVAIGKVVDAWRANRNRVS